LEADEFAVGMITCECSRRKIPGSTPGIGPFSGPSRFYFKAHQRKGLAGREASGGYRTKFSTAETLAAPAVRFCLTYGFLEYFFYHDFWEYRESAATDSQMRSST
jgi:hypothetical protein